ncbi:MAG: TSUP family transporter, partial [Pseudomonadota bacterium]
MSWVTSAVSSAVSGMSPGVIAFCLGAMFVAAFIRGYTGFGSSLLWVPTLSLVLPPVAVVPVTFMLEFIVSIHLLPAIRQDIHWSSLRWIWIGAVLGVPFGLAAIVALPADMTRGAVAATVIVAAVLLWRG